MATRLSRVVFFGTPGFAVPILNSVASVAEVVLVVTQPDRRRGRGRKVSPTEVKVAAQELGIDVIQPEVVKGARFARRVAEYDVDFIVTAAFGRILGRSLLEVPRHCPLNVHASLLPRHRGAAPANWAIIAGDRVSGVSVMRMEQGLDTGPVYCSKETAIGSDDTAGSLLERLSSLGAEAISEVLTGFADLQPVRQEDGEATWAPALEKSDGWIEWDRDAIYLERLVRGMNPWPIATTELGGSVLRVHSSSVLEANVSHGEPGIVVDVSDEGVDVACGRGVLRLRTIQAAGKKQMPAGAFLAGRPISLGTRLGGSSED